MTDDIVTRLRTILSDPKPIFTKKVLEEAADEIERLRKELATEQTYVMLSKADFNELLKIVKLFADNGKCLMHEEQFGYCTCSPCEWHEAEHMWESFCFARGI